LKTDWAEHWKKYNNFIWQIGSWRARQAYKRLLKYANFKNPTIIELGSGSGKNSLFLANTLESPEVVLVDFNDVSLKISKDFFQDSGIEVKFLKEDVLKLNLNDQKWDLVHSEGLIEHFFGEDRASVFKKHVDFCKDNGFVIIFVPCHNLRYALFKKAYEKIIGEWIYDEQEYTKEELRGLCRQFNLRILKEIYLLHEIGIIAKKIGPCPSKKQELISAPKVI
jgi:ubiquinone/menaquinone biosynthesis C-methylase UbiE